MKRQIEVDEFDQGVIFLAVERMASISVLRISGQNAMYYMSRGGRICPGARNTFYGRGHSQHALGVCDSVCPELQDNMRMTIHTNGRSYEEADFYRTLNSDSHLGPPSSLCIQPTAISLIPICIACAFRETKLYT